MKTQYFILFALGVIGLTSCASDQSTPPAPAAAATSGSAPSKGDISNEEAEQKPFIGMTKAQALARYGDPKKHTVTDEGEEWIYLLNTGEIIGRAFIPFNFKPTLARTGVLIFGPDGKVKKFTWDVPTEG